MEELSTNYKEWYHLLNDIQFNCSDQKKDSIILNFLNKLIFVRSLEDFGLIGQNYVKYTWYKSTRNNIDGEEIKSLHIFLKSLDYLIYELVYTHLFFTSSNSYSIIRDIDLRNSQKNQLIEIIQKILGFAPKNQNKNAFKGLYQINFPKDTCDVIGRLYENLKTKQKKEMGIFYTPNYIARYAGEKIIGCQTDELIEKLNKYLKSEEFDKIMLLLINLKSFKIIDPSCGSGIFLINSLRQMWNLYQKISLILSQRIKYYENLEQENKDSTKIRVIITKIKHFQKILHLNDNIECITYILLQNIHGVDIDKSAVFITKLNLWLEAVNIIQENFPIDKNSSKTKIKLPNLDLNILEGNAILGYSPKKLISYLATEKREEMLTLFKFRTEYLDNPYQERIINKIKKLKESLIENINLKFKDSCRLIFNKIEFKGLWKPFHWALEYWYVFLDFEKTLNQNKLNGFNIILGNPPWGADLSTYVEYFKFNLDEFEEKQIDSYQIFLFKAIDGLLEENGFLGFLIPNELCLEEGNASLRKHILNYQIFELNSLGLNIFENVTRPSLFLMIKKTHPPENHLVNIYFNFSEDNLQDLCSQDNLLKEIVENSKFSRNQNSFLKNEKLRFDIFATQLDIEIKNFIKDKNFKCLKEYFSNGRGIDTNKTGKHIICPVCKYLNPPFGVGNASVSKKNCINEDCHFEFKKNERDRYKTEDIILDIDYREGDYQAPGFVGEDIHRFYFSRKPRLIKYYGELFYSPIKNSDFLKNPEELDIMKERDANVKYSKVKWKNPDLYKGEKLLFRKVSSNSLFQIMVSKDFLVTNQQIYIFKKKEEISEVSIYFYLAILASRLVYYYYITEFGDPDKEILPHFTQSKIKSIPVPFPDISDKKYKKLIDKVKSLIGYIEEYNGSNDKIKKESILQKIQGCFDSLDSLVFQYYGIYDFEFKTRIVSLANENGFSIF